MSARVSGPAATTAAAAIAFGVLSLYLLRLDTAAGLIVDDAWYVVLARALSQGDGFRLISSAAAQIMPAVPPGYPLILAPLLLISPAFPANVLLLKFVSIAAMLGAGLVVYVQLMARRETERSTAVLIALATVLTPALVFLATSTLMAESVFILGQVLAVWWLDRIADSDDPSPRQRRAIVAGVIAAATTLIRTAGAACVVAGILFLLKERAYRLAAAFALTAGVCMTPWFIYSARHAPTAAEVEAHGGTIAYAYSEAFTLARPGDRTLGTVGIADVGERFARNLVNVLGRDMGGVIVPAFFRGPDESGEEVVSLGGQTGFAGASMGGSPVTMAITFVLSAIVLLGFVAALQRRVTAADILVVVTLGVVLNVPTRTFRYILPLTPYLLFYFVSGVDMAGRGLRMIGGGVTKNGLAVRIAMMCVLGLHLQDHAQYVAMKLRTPASIDWLRDATAARDLTDWMNTNLADSAPVASTNPGLVYLLTGRHTVATEEFSRGWARWKALGVDYIVALRPLALPPKSLNYEVLYQSRGRQFWVIRILGS